MKPELTQKITFEEFEDCIKQGVEQAMKECELTIGMTLKEAVEKQISKKPVKTRIPKTSWTKAGIKYMCPCCRKYIHSETDFCPNCGQALDWNEVQKNEK